MLQDIPCRVLTATAFSLFVTILMYTTLTHVDMHSTPHKETFKPTLTSGWGDGWQSLLGPGEALEKTTIRSPSGQYLLGLEKDGRLVFQNLALKRNTTFFSPDGVGRSGVNAGVKVPEGVSWHAVLTKRGVLVVYYVLPPPSHTAAPPAQSSQSGQSEHPTPPAESAQPEQPTPLAQSAEPAQSVQAAAADAILVDPAQVKARRPFSFEGLEDLDWDPFKDEKEEEEEETSLFTASIVWDTNRIFKCHAISKWTPAHSVSFLQLDDTGFLQISNSNEINCPMTNPDEERALVR